MTTETRGRNWRLAAAVCVVGALAVVPVARLRAQPQDAVVKLLAELTDAIAPSGFEGPVRDILRREWQGLLADVHTDGIGNLYGTLPGPAGSPRVLVMAHMDEVGFLVRYIDPNGYIFFNNVGGYIDQSVLTQRMTILTPKGPVTGYTGFKSGHIVSAEERSHLVHLQDMFIDIGVKSRAEAEALGIRPGLPITYGTRFTVLNGTNRYLAKAFDDRVGLAVATEALRQLKSLPHPNTVEMAATVQEENGLRGAAVVNATAHPDIVINLEIGIAGDFPLLTSPKLSQEALGKGPGLFVFDASMLPNNNYVNWIVELAQAHQIPFQFESVGGYGEDGAQLQKSGTGIPAVNIGIPTRYGHSQSSVIDRGDFDNTVKLVVQMVQGLSAEQIRKITTF
ncbi:MAG TPA: M42 family metallopeptidase [Vicinamibacterales bacterium]|nr:M42 family metallopeptidase [Vicinamibacterales bacterium]